MNPMFRYPRIKKNVSAVPWIASAIGLLMLAGCGTAETDFFSEPVVRYAYPEPPPRGEQKSVHVFVPSMQVIPLLEYIGSSSDLRVPWSQLRRVERCIDRMLPGDGGTFPCREKATDGSDTRPGPGFDISLSIEPQGAYVYFFGDDESLAEINRSLGQARLESIGVDW